MNPQGIRQIVDSLLQSQCARLQGQITEQLNSFMASFEAKWQAHLETNKSIKSKTTGKSKENDSASSRSITEVITFEINPRNPTT